MRGKTRAILIAGLLSLAAGSPSAGQTTTQTAPAALDPFAALVKESVDAWERLSTEDTPANLPPLKPVEPGLFTHQPPRLEVASDDGMRVAGTRDGQLYVRDRASETIRFLARAPVGTRWTIEDTTWSPDGRFLAAKTIDDREVPRITLTGKQFGPSGKQDVPYSRVGEPLPEVRVVVVEVATGKTVKIKQASNRPYINIVGFSGDNRTLRVLTADRLQRVLELRAADTRSGTTSLLHTEHKPSSMTTLALLHGYSQRLRDLKLVNFLPDGSFVWMSDRSGFQHLTLHDPFGRPLRALTQGNMDGFIDKVVEVDVANRRLFALATGFSSTKPYAQKVVRVDLDGAVVPLAEADSIPYVKVLPDHRRIRLVSASFPDTVKIVEVPAEGGRATTLFESDWGPIRVAGYAWPEIVMVPAADGKTRIRAVIAFPAGFDPAKRYPVIHHIYAGQHTINAPLSPRNAALSPYSGAAQKGFIQIWIDGRATPGRGRAFQNADYGRFGAIQAEDQIAGLKALAAPRPYMDLNRVGVLGGSWGGYFGLRTILAEPNLYKAGVLYAGAFEMARMRVPAEPFMGCSKTECPASYAKASNFAMIERLKTPVLLLHGTADNDVPVEDSRDLVAELKRHGKPHEYIEIDGWTHSVGSWPEFRTRALAYFQTHLGGPEAVLP